MRRSITAILAAAGLCAGLATVATPADAAAYGNIRNGSAETAMLVNGRDMVRPGHTSRGEGIADANSFVIWEGTSVALWHIASNGHGGSMWAGDGCYAAIDGTRSQAVGNTSYYAIVRSGSFC